MNNQKHPELTEYEEKVFSIFASNHKPGFADHSIQLEGNKQLPVVAAGHRMIKKGVLMCARSCCWYLTDLGQEMAELRSKGLK